MLITHTRGRTTNLHPTYKCGFICHIKWQLVRKRIVHVHVRVGRTIHTVLVIFMLMQVCLCIIICWVRQYLLLGCTSALRSVYFLQRRQVIKTHSPLSRDRTLNHDGPALAPWFPLLETNQYNPTNGGRRTAWVVVLFLQQDWLWVSLSVVLYICCYCCKESPS